MHLALARSLLPVLSMGCHVLSSGTIEQTCEDLEEGCIGGGTESGIDESDPDGDGFEGADDCNDTDGNIYPGAPELCDGVDSDCGGDEDYGMVTMDEENYASIQQAIDAAESDSTIYICPGKWNENLLISQSLNLVGTYGADSTKIQAALSESVILIADGRVQIKGLTLSGGTGSSWTFGSTTYQAGGGIQVQGGQLVLVDTTITGNSADFGGGLFVDLGAAETVIQSSLIHNNSSNSGGGAHSYANMSITDSKIYENTANNIGGLYARGVTISLDDSQVHGNLATSWVGGIQIENGELSCQNDSSIYDNKTNEYAGGVLLTNSSISGCTIEENEAVNGAGLVTTDGSTATQLDIRSNRATNGGGLRVSGQLVMDASTIEENQATTGGGIYLIYDGDLQLSSTVLSGNIATVSGGGLSLQDGTASGTNVNFGTHPEPNTPDDIALYDGYSFQNLGTSTSFTCTSDGTTTGDCTFFKTH